MNLPFQRAQTQLSANPLLFNRILGGGGTALQGVMDTVSEVREVKHAFKAGIMARKGVDY